MYTRKLVFKGKRRKIHIHQRAFRVFVGDPFVQYWCMDLGLLSVLIVLRLIVLRPVLRHGNLNRTWYVSEPPKKGQRLQQLVTDLEKRQSLRQDEVRQKSSQIASLGPAWDHLPPSSDEDWMGSRESGVAQANSKPTRIGTPRRR